MLWLMWIKYYLSQWYKVPIPLEKANAHQVYDVLTVDGWNWGREVAFVTWLVHHWGSIKAREVWLHVHLTKGDGRRPDF